ncbi:MAG: hypothetical protein PHC33_03555 [Candidatus Omnitrophica bacterium]|nr:hypothetical protein [Candidatus Omnitrophota bacterium]
MRKITFVLLMVFMAMSMVVSFPGISFAAFSISVTPYQGGYDLRYERVSLHTGRINREVTVRVTSDIGKQYRVIQTILDPLTNAQGKILPSGSFVVYGLRGSNRSGTLSVETERPVGFGREYLYTSGVNGASDSFVLVYGIVPDQDFESGSYRGRMAFTLEPVDSAQAPVNVYLTILAEVEAQPLFEVVTPNLSKEIVLCPDRQEPGSNMVVFKIKGGLGRQFRIQQVVTEQPLSLEGGFLDWAAIKFAGRDNQKGAVINRETPLSLRQEVIYESSSSGEADTFAVDYGLNDISAKKAGKYRTSIKYLLDVPGSELKLIDSVTLIVDNPRVLELLVTPEAGGVIRFTGVRPSQSVKGSEVVIAVRSNTGRQYQVTQRMLSDMVNTNGDILSSRFLKIREEGMDTKGILKFPSAVPLAAGEISLFVSDPLGSGDKFKVIYELTPSLDIKAGDYSAKIVYSILEL